MNALVGLINRACRELLEVDPDGRQKLTALEGKVLCIEITVPQMKLYLKPSSEGFEISENSEAEPDVTLSGSVMAFARLGTSGVGSRVLSEGQVTMQGDAETGQIFQKILAQLDIDWEELLSRYIGDTPARKVGNVLRDFGNWISESTDLSMQNTAEYFQEEKRVLVTNLAMERFQNAVDKLRADSERLEQRVNILKQKLNSDTDTQRIS
jgi:ubiquinone biosynthesis protein UbiJ